MTISIVILLIIVGIILLLLEVLVLPGGITGIIGLLVIAFAIWQAFVMSTTTGVIVLVATLVVSVTMAAIALKYKTWSKISLNTEIDGKTNVVLDTDIKIGDKGVAVSRLAPMGKAQFNGKYFEVATLGEFVDHTTEIEVIKIDGNKIIVKQIN